MTGFTAGPGIFLSPVVIYLENFIDSAIMINV